MEDIEPGMFSHTCPLNLKCQPWGLLVVQRLALHASNAECRFDPGQGTKIPHVSLRTKEKEKKSASLRGYAHYSAVS